MKRVLFLMRLAASVLFMMAIWAALWGVLWLFFMLLGVALPLSLLVAGWDKASSEEWEALENATETVPTPWLIDAFSAPESTPRSTMLAELDANTAWALARLHRKGVPAEYVAERWKNGEPLDADALVASPRAGGAA